MSPKQAQQLISEIFSHSFDRERYTAFLGNLLNKVEPRDKHYSGNLITEAYRDHIHQYWKIGKYTDPDGIKLDLLVVEVKSFSKLDRARSALRNFAINRLKRFDKEASLIAFYASDDGGADWRFSFVKIEHEAFKDDKGKVKLREQLTPAKRYSYLVGEHENSHTACKQLLPVLTMDYADPRIEEIESAFSIEKVTDEFFEQYKVLFQKLAEHLKREPWFQRDSEVEQDQLVTRFAKKLLGQIVFLYFLQKKGWLGAGKDQPYGTGPKDFMRQRFDAKTEAQNFYGDCLQYLFYEALADERKGQKDPGYYERFDCRLPFLNGGLFEADYDWRNETITIPDTLFHNTEKTKAGDVGTGIPCKILFLDDVFIGLDISNRLPLLKILESEFPEYQIFITTYDKPWFEYACGFIGSGWKTMEFYARDCEDGTQMPSIIDDQDLLSKAKSHLQATDYKAAAVYTRSAFEKIIQNACVGRKSITYRRRLKDYTTKDFWDAIKADLQVTVRDDVETYRSLVLNAFSHYNTERHEIRAELNDAIGAIERLKDALRPNP